MPDPLITLSLDRIEADALIRDRTGIAPASMLELRLSIVRNGLRQPIEVFEIEGRAGRYGLISGFRRLAAFRALNDTSRQQRYASIPAFIRQPGSLAGAYAAMVEENEVRAGLSPYERGQIAVRSVALGIFPTIEAAIDNLHASASASKRSRLRAMARVAEALGPVLSTPETLSASQILRLANALRGGFGDILHAVLDQRESDGPQADWQAMLPYVEEAEALLKTPAAEAPPRPGRPRRILRLRQGLTIRREASRHGYTLRFTGKDASSELIDTIMDEIE